MEMIASPPRRVWSRNLLLKKNRFLRRTFLYPAIFCPVFASAVAAIGLLPVQAWAVDSIWNGSVDNSWTNADNWTNGLPDIQRADIESLTDLTNWPTIHTGETVTIGQRIQAPLDLPPGNQTMYARLTIEAGGTLNAQSDFRMGDSGGLPVQPIVGSLNVAGALTVLNRARFGDSSYTTLDIDVTGTMACTSLSQDFRIGTGTGSSVDLTISGNGQVTGEDTRLMIGDGAVVSLSDNAKLSVDNIVDFNTLLSTMTSNAANGRLKGLTNTYSGSETLTSIGNGIAYFPDGSKVTFVSAAVASDPPGDYNHNHVVDAADYVTWRLGLGTTYTQADYDVWRENFGAAAGLGSAEGLSSTNVPECCSLVLTTWAVSALATLRIRRGARNILTIR